MAARGSVLDVAFPEGELPAIREALAVEWDVGPPLAAEVLQHLDPGRVRAVALQGSAGLKRGTRVRRLGAPIRVPVGPPVLGRVLNVLGETTDRGPALAADLERGPIHAAAPALERRSAARERFHTGIKAIDLLAPLVQGGKAAMFGGAGVG
ncbi:MAG TPA: F0F1 ATP synthase subunit beta, partial [Steroidobacteraceae bacterium]|nr:F0F1 ATP synthase subunit beta [Steroidobacteraceae bacterium]